jgi:4-amino-4-deoxy-L-arabinose transferase-like glycosyltransferase
LFVGILSYIGFHFATLSRFPPVWMDEPWYTQPAWSFATEGTFAEPMFEGLYGHEISNVAYGRIYLATAALFFRLFDVGVYQARTPSLLCGLVTLALTYLVGRKLWRARTGLFGAGILAFVPQFFTQTHDARPEIMLAAFMMGSLLLLLIAEERQSPALYALTGLAAGLSADTHLNGLVVPVMIGALFVHWRGLRNTWSRQTAALAAGIVAGLAWWYLVHVAPHPAVFAAQWGRYWGAVPPPVVTLFDQPVALFRAEAGRFVAVVTGHWASALTAAGLGSLACVAALRDRDHGTRVVLVAHAALFVAMALLVSNKAGTYVVLFAPLLALAAARGAAVLEPSLPMAARVGAGVWLTLLGAWGIRRAENDHGAGYYRYAERIEALLPEGAKVQAEPTLWFGLKDRPFIADHVFKFQRPYETYVRKLGIEFIIADEFFRVVQLERQRSIDKAEVEAFLRDHAMLVGRVEDPYYGGDGTVGLHVTEVWKVLPE